MESNRRRTGGPQGDELDSAWNGDEPAGLWRSLELTGYAEVGCESDDRAVRVVGGGTFKDVWVGEAGRPVAVVTVAGVRVLVVPCRHRGGNGFAVGRQRRRAGVHALPESHWDVRESRGQQNPRVGKRDRKVEAGSLG